MTEGAFLVALNMMGLFAFGGFTVFAIVLAKIVGGKNE